jgi:hypothetical protein
MDLFLVFNGPTKWKAQHWPHSACLGLGLGLVLYQLARARVPSPDSLLPSAFPSSRGGGRLRSCAQGLKCSAATANRQPGLRFQPSTGRAAEKSMPPPRFSCLLIMWPSC